MINNVNLVVEYILKYGIIFLFFIVYLEYLNLPGLPGGVILPAIGVLIANNEYSFFGVFIISVLAGVWKYITILCRILCRKSFIRMDKEKVS